MINVQVIPPDAQRDSALTDAELMSRVAQQDQAALMALYQRYGAQVYSLALHVLRNPGWAEEATQDTFLKLWDKGAHWDPEQGQLSSWLLTIARYTAIDRLRRELRHTTAVNAFLDVQDSNLEANAAVDDAHWQDGQLLRALMAQLPAEQRQAIELAFFQGLTHSEIAERLSWPLGTVKTRMRLGLQKLRHLWLEATQQR
jgi:RNA polymerase sigma-70 factor (ECF subfamily)